MSEYVSYNEASQLAEEFTNILQEAASTVGRNFQKGVKRKARVISTKEEVEEILSIDHFKASEKDTIMELFGDFGEGPKYNPYDIIEVPAHRFGGLSKNKNAEEEAGKSSTKTNTSK